MRILIRLTPIAALMGCTMAAAQGPAAVATLEPTKGNSTEGTVTFTQNGDKVTVAAKVTGLTPALQGSHIHEKGNCSSGDGMSSGGHLNPGGKPHENPTIRDHHAGDMPPLEADAPGNASLTGDLNAVRIGGGATDVIGKAVIVHKDPDDFTQPTGNSGARVACGVIRKS
jgi:Cu-Zn family superoxide dismutase